jgi:hypothetical protein
MRGEGPTAQHDGEHAFSMALERPTRQLDGILAAAV